MRRTQTRRAITAWTLLLSAGLAPQALAQVAPPPPAEPAKEPAYVPPAPPPQRQTPAIRPQPQQQADHTDASGFKRQPVKPPNIPFKTLVVRDESGLIIPLNRPVALAALANNPTVSDAIRDKVMPIVHEREIRQEERILTNFDLYLAFEGGLLDQTDTGNIDELGKLTQRITPLVEQGDIGLDLEAAGVLSGSQRSLNDVIVQEYKKAVTDDIRLHEGQNLGALFRSIIEDALIEPRFAYGLMVAELIQHPGAIEKAGLETAANIDGVKAAMDAGWPEDNDARRKATNDMRAALSRLTPEDQEALLRASRELREDPTKAPLPEIPLTVDGQRGSINHNIGVHVEKGDAPELRHEKKTLPAGDGG